MDIIHTPGSGPAIKTGNTKKRNGNVYYQLNCYEYNVHGLPHYRWVGEHDLIKWKTTKGD